MKYIIAKAQNGDNNSLIFLIEKYLPLIKKYANTYHLKSYDYDDLVQEGTIAVMKAVKKFDNSREKNSFDSYAINTIKNSFKMLARNQIKYKDESSLNLPIDDGLEIIDLIEDSTLSTETFITNKITHIKLQELLSKLSPKEKELIKEVYFSDKGSLRKYCLKNNITFYYGKKELESVLIKLNFDL